MMLFGTPNGGCLLASRQREPWTRQSVRWTKLSVACGQQGTRISPMPNCQHCVFIQFVSEYGPTVGIELQLVGSIMKYMRKKDDNNPRGMRSTTRP